MKAGKAKGQTIGFRKPVSSLTPGREGQVRYPLRDAWEYLGRSMSTERGDQAQASRLSSCTKVPAGVVVKQRFLDFNNLGDPLANIEHGCQIWEGVRSIFSLITSM